MSTARALSLERIKAIRALLQETASTGELAIKEFCNKYGINPEEDVFIIPAERYAELEATCTMMQIPIWIKGSSYLTDKSRCLILKGGLSTYV